MINHVSADISALYRWIFPLALIGASLFSSLTPGYIGSAILSYTLVVWVIVCILYYSTSFGTRFCGRRIEEECPPQIVEFGFTSPPPPTTTSSPRLYYLDDLKTFLTIVVIVHHCLGAFNGSGNLGLSVGNFYNPLQVFTMTILILSQSYFMSLFFFVSAYFIPSSIVRKGSQAFLADRFKRLGPPALAYAFIIGALLSVLCTAFGRGQSWNLNMNASVTWFLFYLLLFSYAHVWADRRGAFSLSPPRERPSLAIACGIGGVCGLLQAVQILLLTAFPFMPITFGSLPQDVLFFWAGLEAAKGKWLSTPFTSGQVQFARAVTVLFSTLVFATFSSLYVAGGGGAFISHNACGEPADLLGELNPLWILVILFIGSTLAGVYAVCISVTLLDFFRSICGNAPPGPMRVWLSATSYSAYVLHPFVVVTLTGAFISIIKATTKSPLDTWGEGTNDSTACIESWMLIVGLILVSILSPLITFPLAAAIRSLPYVRNVL